MKLKPGRWLGVLIVVTWAGLFTSRWTNTYTRRGDIRALELDGPGSSLNARLTQRGIFYRGIRIGYIREGVTWEADGLKTEQQGRLTLNVMGEERSLLIEGAALLGVEGRLRSFDFAVTTSSGALFATRVGGEVEGDVLRLSIESGTSTHSETRRLRKPIVLPLNVYRTLASQGLSPGQEYVLQLFDPLTLSEGEAEVSVLEPEVVRWGNQEEEALRVRTRFRGLTTLAWIAGDGEVIKEETPLGWTLLKEAPGTGLAVRSDNTALPDVVSSSAIPAIGFAGEADALQRVRLRLNGFPPGWTGLDGGRQSVDGDELVISREQLPLARGGELAEDERLTALASDAFVQSEDPAIREQALALTGQLPPLEAARALSRWVHVNVRKTPTLSLPNAREVLENRRGDCNEHTVLFTALARAAGIPTRISTGLAFTGGQFYYHAWPEVWVGAWVALDPTFGQFPADPLHVRLVHGGLEGQYEILNLMGRGATIEILEAE